MKRDPWERRQAFCICNVLAFYGYADEQREVIRRIEATSEFHEASTSESMVRMSSGLACEATADRQTRTQTALLRVAARICDEVQAESMARDEAEQATGGAS